MSDVYAGATPAHGLFEELMGIGSDGCGVALYGVVDELARHESKRYSRRSTEQIRRQYVHHSGALRGGDPFEHMAGSARYVVRHRGWPGFAYHTWIPFFDVFDRDGNRVVYRGNLDETVTYHAGAKPNRKGIAHCLQGNLSKREMSEHQMVALPVVLKYFAKRHGITDVPIGHFQATDGHAKESCPGMSGKAWIHGYQASRLPT